MKAAKKKPAKKTATRVAAKERDEIDKNWVTKATGTRCSECGEPQFTTPGGDTCDNGHGGAPPAEEVEDVSFDAPPPDAAARQLAGFAAMGEQWKAWRPARQVLTRVRAVRTIFPQYDRATRVNGHPLQRFGVVHGPSGNGKTAFLHGLGLSFLKESHAYALVDAERTTPEDWLDQLMAEYADHPGFYALRPSSYEQTVDAVREFMKKMVAARLPTKNDKGKPVDPMLAPSTSGLIVVDSLRKLVPENILAKILKNGAEGKAGSVDGMSGRAAMIRAAMNGSWLDELVPMLDDSVTTMMVVARESEDVEADANDRAFDNAWKMQGGKAIEFDSSVVMRITRSWVKDGKDDEESKAPIVGERHKVCIRKTKVAGKDGKVTVCYFHTSNGVLVPPGFDRARDVLELAREYKLVAENGSWLTWGAGGMRWQGISNAVKKLTERKDALDELETRVRAQFRPDEPLPMEDAN